MQAAIFDLDGTLLDSMHIWADVDAEFLAKRGIVVPDDYTEIITPMSLDETAVYTIARFGLEEGVDDLKREWNRMVEVAYTHDVGLKPYAREYLLSLKEHGMKLAVATSLPRSLYEPALANNGLLHLFDALCSTDEVGVGKRRPDVFLLAAERLATAASSCVVYEDLLEAIISARQAGMTTYAVYDESSKAGWQKMVEIADGTIYNFKDAAIPGVGATAPGCSLVL
ncbi:MAG TPA: HAD family hydrolase [Coriobacteriia bacterium]|nr:HAD family hydrolase [Coriobacteriia bacterium]